MKSLGLKIKELRIDRGVSQKTLADALQIGQTTIANYEADIRQPNLEKLSQIADYFDVSLDELMGRFRDQNAHHFRYEEADSEKDKEISWDYNQLAKAYMDLLLSHKKAEAIEFVRQLYRQGMAVTDIYAQVFARTLQETGRLWADGIINICEEHYISEITQTLVSHLSVARLGGPETGKKVVVMNMEGEKHVIAGKMLADFLERSGLETFYLGKDIPLRSLIDNLIVTSADLLVISATMEEYMSDIGLLISDLKQHPKLAKLKILVGGQAFEKKDTLWVEIDADGTAKTFEEAVQIAHELLEIDDKDGREGA